MTKAQIAALRKAILNPRDVVAAMNAELLAKAVTEALRDSERRSVEFARASRVEPTKLHEPFTV